MVKDKNLEKGQKRMLHIKIWQNESFAMLHPLARLLYIGLILLADDDGKLKGNTTLLKSQIFPFDAKMRLETFKVLLKQVIKSKLVELYRVNSDYFISHPNWKKYQYIRADLYKSSSFPDNPLQTCNDNVTDKIPKKREEKKRKEKGEETAKLYLLNIPEEDENAFYKRFECSRKQINSKAEDLLNWCKANNQWKVDYKAFLLNALKKDFSERVIAPIRKPEVPKKEEEKERVPIPKDIKADIKRIIGNKQIK